MNSFKDLLVLHQELDEMFFEHQRALLQMDLGRASTWLERYETELLEHIRDEEELMIPIYRELVEAPVGGAAEIFVGEHEKLRQFLVLFREGLTRLAAAEDLERGVLFLLDSQHLFKRLLVHHDARERKYLYPLLDQVTTETDRATVFQKLRRAATSEVVT
ncbi:MAG TPA: hemerythrin domain-containing protein [Pyrinomonadaceae bacterium]